MAFMSGNHEGQGENADILATSVSATKPGLIVEMTDEKNGGVANGRKFLKQI